VWAGAAGPRAAAPAALDVTATHSDASRARVANPAAAETPEAQPQAGALSAVQPARAAAASGAAQAAAGGAAGGARAGGADADADAGEDAAQPQASALSAQLPRPLGAFNAGGGLISPRLSSSASLSTLGH